MSTSTTQPDAAQAPETDSEAPVAAENQSEVPESTPEGPSTQQEAVKRAYSAATTALREAHREEFHKDVAARVKEFGFEWTPKPTAKEKASAEIKRLAAEAGLTPQEVAALAR